MQSINPATGLLIEEFSEHSPSEVESILTDAHHAFTGWKDVSFDERARHMLAAAEALRADAEIHAQTMTREMGKPITQARAEVEKCAWVCEYYAGNAERMLAAEEAVSDGSRAYVRHDPLGPVLAVMPWNFPYWQVFRFAAPALMAGNAGLLKHASNVTRCALHIEDVFRAAGFPDGLFRSLLIGSGRVADVLRHPHISAATLTGSEPAGAAVASLAGSLLKKTVLELGGSDPFVVLDDADIEKAAVTAAAARCLNTGQSCIAAKRFIVMDAVADRFEEVFVRAMAARRVGDPMRDDTDIGPLARPDLVDDLERQVRDTLAAGARLLLGGKRMSGSGYFYEPTVLGGVTPGMAAHDEETFGPVAVVVRVADADEAVTVANATPFGLGASVWTRDTGRAERIAAAIESGSVFINGLVKSDPRLPFGGVKRSGYGRELSWHGIREFVNTKTVWVA